ncbi:MAG: 3-hydroxybutyryl-CoA dehydratase [Acidobacteria bacterium]|nr:3-hydroxybutyryl-CoA dehydratase [Acidobacteriota bacterium]
MADQVVLYAKEGNIGSITINRPEMKNPLNMGVFTELDKALDKVAADKDLRAVVVTGAGNAFVSGADINELLGYSTQEGWTASRFQQSVFNKLEKVGIPSIAAINGFALGGGLELALSCTYRIASTKAKLGFPELGLGIIPAFGGTERLVRTVGYAKASELILFRSIIGSEEALRFGLVHEVAEPEQLLDKAREKAQNLASLSPVAVRLEMELLLNIATQGLDTSLALESSLGALAVSSPQAKELLGAFLSKGKK